MNRSPESVLVLRFSAVGDVVLTSPAIEALHNAWPKARIIYAVKERLAPLVQHNPFIGEVVPLRQGEGPLSFSRRLRATGYEVLLDLHDKIRSKMLRALLPLGPRCVWHKRDLTETVAVKLGLQPYHARMRFADRYHAAVERLVGATLPRGRLRYFLGPDDVSLATELLRGAGVSLAAPILCVSPGANWETKRWPAARFAELARRALARGFQVVVQGSASETRLAQEVAREAPGAVDLSAGLDLPVLGGVLSLCAAFVGNDSGPMHMARALGVPTLALFGSTDPEMFEFAGHRALFVEGIPCAPCSFYGRARCPRGHFRCMRELEVDAAWEAFTPLAEGGRRPLVSA